MLLESGLILCLLHSCWTEREIKTGIYNREKRERDAQESRREFCVAAVHILYVGSRYVGTYMYVDLELSDSRPVLLLKKNRFGVPNRHFFCVEHVVPRSPCSRGTEASGAALQRKGGNSGPEGWKLGSPLA